MSEQSVGFYLKSAPGGHFLLNDHYPASAARNNQDAVSGFAAGIEAAAAWHESEAERIRLLALDSDEPRRFHEAQDDHLSHAAFIRGLMLSATSADTNPVNAREAGHPCDPLSEVSTQIVDSYRGIAIHRTADVNRFPVPASDQFCFVARYRPSDDAPVLSTHPTIEACRYEIDELAAEAGYGTSRVEKLLAALEGCAEHPGTHADDLAWAKTYRSVHKQDAKAIRDPLMADAELLRRAVSASRERTYRKGQKHPRWVAVMDAFQLGSGYARELCRRFQLDPDEEVSR